MATLSVPSVFTTIREAINAAATGDTILIAAGTYDITYPGYNNSLTYSATANCSTGFTSVTSLTYDGAGNFGDASFTTITGNARLFQQNVDGQAPISVIYKDLDFLYNGGSGYILSTNATNLINMDNLSFRGTHTGNAGANGNYSDVRNVTNFNLSNSSVSLTGQAGFNPAAGTGGSSFLLLNGGAGGAITINNNSFDEAGYRNALSIFDSVNVTISGNTFFRSSNPSVRTGGEKLKDTSATVSGNTFRDGAYLVLDNTSTPARTSAITGNRFTALDTTSTLAPITGPMPRGIVLESGNAAITGSSFQNNAFEYVSPFENKTATLITLTGMGSNTFTDPITGTNKSFSSYYIGGTGADTITGTTAGEFFNAGAGSATINTGASTTNQDFILFNSPIGLGNVVTINNFDTNDRILLDRRIFAGIQASPASPLVGADTAVLNGVGAVMASNINNNANQPQIRLVFNNGTGNLSYDPDGNGPQGATLFAVINGSNLTGMNPAFNNRAAVNIGMI